MPLWRQGALGVPSCTAGVGPQRSCRWGLETAEGEEAGGRGETHGSGKSQAAGSPEVGPLRGQVRGKGKSALG